jgi:hypothetical protein
MVAAAIMKEMNAITGGMATCRYRSPVLSACQALHRIAMTAMRYGGVVKRSVVMLLLPNPFTTLFKQVVSIYHGWGLEILHLHRKQSSDSTC